MKEQMYFLKQVLTLPLRLERNARGISGPLFLISSICQDWLQSPTALPPLLHLGAVWAEGDEPSPCFRPHMTGKAQSFPLAPVYLKMP